MTARRTTTILATAAVLAGALALAPTTAGGQAATCEEPYSPVAFAESYPAQEELPTVDATVVSTLVPSFRGFDSDGDGTDDTVASGSGQVTIGRGDGDVVLTYPSGASAGAAGDIDGDGRDEFVVSTTGGAYLIPGTVAPGTQPVEDAGILLPDGVSGSLALEDGSERLLLYRPAQVSVSEATTDVHDGGAILAEGPGGDAGGATPSLSVPGQVRFLADLGGPTVFVSGRRMLPGGAEDRIELFVVDGTDVVELTTLPERYLAEYVEEYGAVEVLDGPDGTFVTLVQSSRSGAYSYMWSLTDPCTALVDDTPTPTPTTPTAPPASPVDAEAAFTG